MTRIEGEKLINNMASAGCLLRFHNAVYLRPSVRISSPSLPRRSSSVTA
jgi:hypothetical protein